MHLISNKKTKGPRESVYLNKCSMSSIPVNLFRMWSVRPIPLGPGISMEFRWMDFMYVLSVQAAITRCFLWPNYFGWHDKNLIGASKNSGWEHTMRGARWGNASKDSWWQNFYGAMLHQGRSKKMTLQLANLSAGCVTLEYNISSQQCLEFSKCSNGNFYTFFWALIISGETFRLVIFYF